jgi:zinc/manganese transport system substrate-binding protein
MVTGLQRAVRLSGVLALVLVLAAGAFQPTSAQGNRLRVVATNSITGDLVRNVAGDRADVTVLVAANGDSHTYEPTPADANAIASADLVFENGLGLEPWLDDVFDASGSSSTRVVVTQQIIPLRVADEPQFDNAADATPVDGDPATRTVSSEPVEGEFDPHVWFDVANVKLMVAAIETALVAADAANADAYHTNAASYQTQLDTLDRFVLDQVATLPESNRKLVTSHDTFAYFAQRYGFQIVGTALPSITTESADPSAAEIAQLVDDIEAAGVAAIFPENVSNPALLDQIASEAGVTVGPPLFTDALGAPDSEGGTYLDMITYDVTAIVTALQG